MNWKFWVKKKGVEPEVTNVRNIGDIKISVTTGLSDTRDVKVSGWNPEMTKALFWEVWDGLVKREDE